MAESIRWPGARRPPRAIGWAAILCGMVGGMTAGASALDTGAVRCPQNATWGTCEVERIAANIGAGAPEIALASGVCIYLGTLILSRVGLANPPPVPTHDPTGPGSPGPGEPVGADILPFPPAGRRPSDPTAVPMRRQEAA